MADDVEQLDTSIRIVTPENIAFEYRLAGPFHRLWAYLIDLAIRIVIMFIGFFLLVMFGVASASTGIGSTIFSMAVGWYLVAWFFLDWFAGGMCEALWNGQTPGKRLCGLRVLTVEGQPISAWQACLRNFLRSADAMPLLGWGLSGAHIFGLFGLYTIGLGASAASRRFQRLGDLAADTMVIIEPPAAQKGVIRITEPEALRLALQLPANLKVNRSLGRALSRYVARRMRFSWQRRCEIAWHLAEPLREKFSLPPTTNPDLLLCAIYHRTFISAGAVDEAPPAPPGQTAPTTFDWMFPTPPQAGPGYEVSQYVNAWPVEREAERR